MSGPLLVVRYMPIFWRNITLTGRFQTLSGTAGGISVAVDIIITISLCTLLALTRIGFHPERVPFSPLCVMLCRHCST